MLYSRGAGRNQCGSYGFDEVGLSGVWIGIKALLTALLLHIGTPHHLGLVPVHHIPRYPDLRTVLAPSCLRAWVGLALFLILHNLYLVLLQLLLDLPLWIIILLLSILSLKHIIVAYHLHNLLLIRSNHLTIHLEIMGYLEPFKKLFLLSIILLNNLMIPTVLLFIG
jgi:hypothetical protein